MGTVMRIISSSGNLLHEETKSASRWRWPRRCWRDSFSVFYKVKRKDQDGMTSRLTDSVNITAE